jgi:cellulose synthase/poly-beta-1,6-N-acetylglucosamine synthase-like glycosyltransferase
MEMYRAHNVKYSDPWYLPVVLYGFLSVAVLFGIWRSAVVNWHVWFGPVAYAAELLSLLLTVLFVLSLRRAVRPVPRPVCEVRRTVDVLIPTVDESVAVLEATVLGALRVRGVREVLVLDDGAREEVRRLAGRLAARYVPRTTRAGSKAGNLNHGLTCTDAELVVTLDADHVPMPDLLEQTVGWFDDPGVGWVQSPQMFYNTDSFTFRRRRGRAGGWHEQEMFYGSVQPAKAATNSAIYTGTSAVLRRAALDSIGGFATGTPTEDIHTSIRLHARGWRSVYTPGPLAYGLEVENLQEYFGTRRRWAVGALQLLLRHHDSPLRVAGLSGWQRLNYLSSLSTHLWGPVRVAFVVVSLAVLLTGVAPVTGAYALYGFAFVAFTVLSVLAVLVLGRGHFHLVHSGVFGMADCVAQVGGLRGLIGGEPTFQVTRKRPGRVTGAPLKAAYRAFFAVNLAGLAVVALHLLRGQEIAMAAWTGTFLAITVGYSGTMLAMTRRYERRPARPSLPPLGGEELYRHVLASVGDRVPTAGVA